jgi:hypothetical protein
MRFSTALLAWCLSFAAFAGTYKWVDENGVTHYSDRIPPEHADRGNQELNRRGVVIKKTAPALTSEQRKAIAEEREARALEEKKAVDQKRQDEALLLTYTSVEEIDAKQEREMQQAELAMRNMEVQHRYAQAQLQEQLKLKATYTASDKEVLDQLVFDIAKSQERMAWLEEHIAAKRWQLVEIQARYDGYKKRFAELKGDPAR